MSHQVSGDPLPQPLNYEENRQNALDFSRGMNAVLRYLYYVLHLSQL